MNALEKMFKQSSAQQDYYKNYCRYVSELITHLDTAAVEEVVNCFLKARREDKTIYFAGNGGSASTASHFCQDVSEIGRKIKGKGFRAQSITDNVSAVTAIANDYNYDSIFSMQIQYNFNPGDVLVCISASGNSPNVINAANLAKEKGGTTVALVGFSGGRLAEICDITVHIKTQVGEYGPVEDVHLMLDHIITSYLIMALRNESGA